MRGTSIRGDRRAWLGNGPGAFLMPATHHIAVQLLQLGNAGGCPWLPCLGARPLLPFLNHSVA
jgi:hypothetical protein